MRYHRFFGIGLIMYTIGMVSWSTKRQITIAGSLALFLVIFVALPVFFVLYQEPTCFDGKKNQGEEGVDCGGSCALLCKADAFSPIIHWQRSFKVTDGVYTALAYIENPNDDSIADSVPYSFKLYDKDNILIAERKGNTPILSRSSFVVFEDTILTGQRTPSRTFFEFTAEPEWIKGEKKETTLRIKERFLSRENTAPRLDATINNEGIDPVFDIEIVAILYNALGNAIASSRTFVDVVDGLSKKEIVFTWSKPFTDAVSRIELIIDSEI